MGGLFSSDAELLPQRSNYNYSYKEYESYSASNIRPFNNSSVLLVPEGFKRTSHGFLVRDPSYTRDSCNNVANTSGTVSHNTITKNSATLYKSTLPIQKVSKSDQSTQSASAAISRTTHCEDWRSITCITKNNVLQQILPSVESSPSILMHIPYSDPIYRQIGKNSAAFNRPRKILTVISIEKVKNPYLEAMYNLKKLNLKDIYGNGVMEKNLFHGATAEKIDLICKQNFNYRLCGTNRGYKYGHGISFSPKFTYANYFCDKRMQVRTMLWCKVLFVKAHIGDEYTIVPCEGYDTTMRDNGKVIVKYDDDVFYPEYVIKFCLT